MDETTRQRLDKWIWFARVVKTREAAATLIETGNVRVNRMRVTKPGYDVSPGDTLTISVHGRVRVLEVLAFAARRGQPGEALLLYREDAMPPADTAVPKKGDASPRRTC